jgi:putative endonuclease
MTKKYWVYIVTNKFNTTLHVGVTDDLHQRVIDHRENKVKGSASMYNCHILLWFEETGNMKEAIAKEKQMKKWKREHIESEIKKLNPEMKDLFDSIP